MPADKRLAPFLIVLLLLGVPLRAADAKTKRDPEPTPANGHEQLAADMAKFTDDVAATLKAVTDEASAKAAVPQFDEYRKRVLALRETTGKLGRPDAATRDAMMAKFGPRLKASAASMAKEQKRIEADAKLAELMAGPLAKLQVFESKAADGGTAK